MKLAFLMGRVFLTVSVCHLKMISGHRLNRKELNDVGLTTEEIIRKYGYPVETHTTETEDGYFVTLFRIPHGKNSTSPGFPILAAHGFASDSSGFVLYGEKSLAFFLADEGYDVWLTNMRGTPYSRKHKRLSDRSSRFWDFSWHEYGVYDLPAFTDYVCNYTERPDVLLLGYSMGGTAVLVMTSLRLDYSRKLRGAVMLGPVTTIKYSTTPLRLFTPLLSHANGLMKVFMKGQYRIQSDVFQNVIKLACNSTVQQLRMCKAGLFMMSGYDPDGFDDATVMNLMYHLQSSTSTKTFVHYSQVSTSGKFRQFNYGLFGNLRRYKRPSPPEYPLELITTPMSVFVAPNDILATRRDIEETLKGRPFVKNIYYVPRKSFGHLDFIVAKDVKEQVYYELSNSFKYLIGEGGIRR